MRLFFVINPNKIGKKSEQNDVTVQFSLRNLNADLVQGIYVSRCRISFDV